MVERLVDVVLQLGDFFCLILIFAVHVVPEVVGVLLHHRVALEMVVGNGVTVFAVEGRLSQVRVNISIEADFVSFADVLLGGPRQAVLLVCCQRHPESAVFHWNEIKVIVVLEVVEGTHYQFGNVSNCRLEF